MCIFGVVNKQMVRFFSIMFGLSMIFASCGKSEQTVMTVKDNSGKPCNIKIEILGGAEEVQFTLFSKAKEKTVTIDRQINVLDDVKDEFSFSSYTGGKMSCELKTKDSYGPEVTLKVFVNGKFWLENTGKYNPKVEGVIPSNL